MFGFLQSADKKWKKSFSEISAGKISVQEFVDINEKKVLFYTTPIISDSEGRDCPNALSFVGNTMYMPAFSNVEDLKRHYRENGRTPNVIIKGKPEVCFGIS